MGFNPKSVAAMLENIVYFELRRKGYDVYIGKNATKEIDFVAVRRDERIYVQVCRNLPEESDREVANLLEIKEQISEDPKGKPPAVLCVLCGMANAAYQRPDGVFVVPITALKN